MQQQQQQRRRRRQGLCGSCTHRECTPTPPTPPPWLQIAESTGSANDQHYEVPAAFYDLCLGPWKKYSCGLWEPGVTSLAASEEAALRVVCERARITADAGPLRVLDMGCGWGSATLYIASHFPNVQMVSVSVRARARAGASQRVAARV